MLHAGVIVTKNEALQELSSARGARCTSVELVATNSWSFNFEGRLWLNVQCPWRITSECGIELGSEDHGQQFGLPAPVDGSATAMRLLGDTPLQDLFVAEKTGDIAFEFESGVRLDVFNHSAAYEGWSCGTPSGFTIIGMGGGVTAKVIPKT